MKLESTQPNPHYPDVSDVHPREVFEKMQNLHLVDVRGADEYAGELGHIENSHLIVLDTLPDNIQKVPKDKTVVFVCRSGGRSARAALFFQQQGYNNVYNMAGGMLMWNQLDLPKK